ncbi:MAG TPA: HNH endonuclease signature motif containing protein [Ktedonobacterales bacterium]
MSATYIPARLRRAVISRALQCCENCWTPDDAPLVAHEVDHVIAERHKGKTELANLAYACFRCNRLKGSDLSSIDPQTGTITRLYNPRTDRWIEHFRLLTDAAIVAQSAIGRTTLDFLDMNDPELRGLRGVLMQQGRYAPPS